MIAFGFAVCQDFAIQPQWVCSARVRCRYCFVHVGSNPDDGVSNVSGRARAIPSRNGCWSWLITPVTTVNRRIDSKVCVPGFKE